MSDEEQMDFLLGKGDLGDKEVTEPEDHFTLVFPYTEPREAANDLYFYKLDVDGNKLVKKIIGGEVFLQYDAEKHELIYLVNKTKKKSPPKRTSTLTKDT